MTKGHQTCSARIRSESNLTQRNSGGPSLESWSNPWRFARVLLYSSEQLNLVIMRSTQTSLFGADRYRSALGSNHSVICHAMLRETDRHFLNLKHKSVSSNCVFVSQIHDLSVACYFIWYACRSSFGKFLEGSWGSANCCQKSELRSEMFETAPNHTDSVSKQLDCNRATDYTVKKSK